jgi:hypothetical protein
MDDSVYFTQLFGSRAEVSVSDEEFAAMRAAMEKPLLLFNLQMIGELMKEGSLLTSQETIDGLKSQIKQTVNEYAEAYLNYKTGRAVMLQRTSKSPLEQMKRVAEDKHVLLTKLAIDLAPDKKIPVNGRSHINPVIKHSNIETEAKIWATDVIEKLPKALNVVLTPARAAAHL